MPELLTKIREYRAKIGMSQSELAELTGVRLSAAEIASAARRGEEPALEVYRTAGQLLGKAAALAANLLNPAAIVFGGGVAQSFDLFRGGLEEKFKSDIMTSNRL